MPKKKTVRTKEPKKGEIKKELKTAASLIKKNIKAAWNSKEKARAEKEINEAVEEFTDGVNKMIEKIKEEEIDKKIKSGFHKSLKKVNQTMRKTEKKWTPVDKKK